MVSFGFTSDGILIDLLREVQWRRSECIRAVPDLYIFENVGNGEKGGKPAGAAFLHKKSKGFTLLAGGKSYVAFPPKAKTAAQPEQSAQGGGSY
jgi:hypothetical protein